MPTDRAPDQPTPSVPRREKAPDTAHPDEAPVTVAGKALVGWIRPNLRGGLRAAVRSIEAEAGRTALASFRERVAVSSSPWAEEVIRLIDQAMEESAEPDRTSG